MTPALLFQAMLAIAECQNAWHIELTARNGWCSLRAAIASSRLSGLRSVTCLSGLALHIGCLQLDYGPTLAQSSSFDCAIAIDCAALLLISSLACVELLDTATNELV